MPSPRFYRNPSGLNKSYALRGDEKPACLILAEGSAEAWFLERWLDVAGCNPSDVAVVCFEGQSQLGANFRSLVEEENFSGVKKLGFLLDAEKLSGPAVADSIRQMLQRNGLIPKTSTLSAGVPADINGIRIAVHVSPDNLSPGFVEHVVLNEIRTHQWASCINAFEAAIVGVGRSAYPKTLVSAFLGIHEAGLCGTQHGFSKGYLDVMHDAYADIRTTLSHLI